MRVPDGSVNGERSAPGFTNGDFSAKGPPGSPRGAVDIWSDSAVSLLVWQQGETNLPSWRTPPCAPVVRNGPLRTARTQWRFLNAAPPSGPSRQYAATQVNRWFRGGLREDEGHRTRERLSDGPQRIRCGKTTAGQAHHASAEDAGDSEKQVTSDSASWANAQANPVIIGFAAGRPTNAGAGAKDGRGARRLVRGSC